MSASSVLRHVEEIVLATSGLDAFEIVFAVGAARLAGSRADARAAPGKDAEPEGIRGPRLRRSIAAAARRYPMLELEVPDDAHDELLLRVDELFGRAIAAESVATLDAVFESLVPRIAKGDKGQFFTPRHVVELVIGLLAPGAGDIVVDPACGSGAFLSQALARGAGAAHGSDIDGRAVRVARLLALAASADPRTIVRADGLREARFPVADVVATNPPFAGRASAEGFEVEDLVRTPERDILFLERSVALLRPGGRLGIVLPYNKASGSAFRGVRRWLVEQARILAIVGLPRETFLPHTSQRTFVLFAQKRACPVGRASLDPAEKTMFLVSERAGKDSGGEPIHKDGALDHDLGEVARTLGPFLAKEGFLAPRPAGASLRSRERSVRTS